MQKLIRVILSLDPTGFAAGILTANNALQLLQTAINLLKSAFGELQEAMAGAAEEEKMNFQLGLLMGNTQLAADYFDQLQKHVEGWGVVLDDIKPSVQQLALGLKQVDGAVDPDKLTRYTDIVLELSHVTGQSVDDISTAIRRAITTGDLGVLQRGLGINVEAMKGLSEETQRVLASMNQAQETQLGAVTKVGGGVKPTSDQILKALEEVTQKLGGSKEALKEYGQSWEGQIHTLEDLFDQLKDTFGKAFIDEMLPALRKFTAYLIEHKEEILEFVKKMATFTADGIIDMAEALSKVDWKSIGEAMIAIGAFIGGGSSGFGRGVTAAQAGTAGHATGIAGVAQNAISQGSTSQGESVGQSIAEWFSNLVIKVDMDSDGQWKSWVDKSATKAVGDVVQEATSSAGGGKKSSKEHGT